MDNPTPAVFQAIRASAEAALQSARDLDDEGRLALGAINWAHLHVVEVLFCRDEAGGTCWRVLIEEANPGCELGSLVYAHLKAEFPDQAFDVGVEW
jgi:hypothetical protein